MTEQKSAQVIRTACRGCHGVCQVLVHMEGDRVVKITGDPDSPTSKGFLCPKGRAAPDVLYHPDRLLYPLRRAGKRGENSWQRISWDDALDEMADRLSQIREKLGPEFFAMAQGTGRPYTEFTLRFAHAFGTPNFVSPGHLCFLPRVIASEITLGRLPISDIYGFGGEMPQCIMVWGCNITYSGAADGMCGGMLERALKKAQKVIVVDPRRIDPVKRADQWLQIRPGTDAALALAMIQTIISEDLFDRDFVNRHTTGFDRLREHVTHFDAQWAESIAGVDAEEIRNAARTYARTKPAVIQWGNGIDMNTSSFQAARAILILMAVTGNIDKPGGEALWVYPDGVKVKSILLNHEQAGVQFLSADQKARGIGEGLFPFAPGTHSPTFWKSVVTGDPYRVKALWLVGTNPLTTATQQLTIQRALADYLEFTVVSDLFMTPTAQYADLVLPAAMWLEQEDVVSMHKIWCILARKKVAQLGETRDDRDVMFDLAHRLGLHEAFPWKDRRAFNEWVLEDTGLDFDQFCDREILIGDMRYRKYETEGFPTPSGKFELFSSIAEHAGVEPLPIFREANGNAGAEDSQHSDFPLTLIGGHKNRYFFHSELRQIPSLRAHNPDPLVEIHPDTAASQGIGEGDWVVIESPYGAVRMKATLFDGIAPDVVNAQHGWWFPEADPPDYQWRQSNINLLFPDSGFDPDSGSEPIRGFMCRIRREETERRNKKA